MQVAIRKPAIEQTPTPSPYKLCARTGCDNPLHSKRGKYCSYRCRNLVNSPGNAGGAPSKYRAEYAREKLFEYLELCERGNEPTLIPTKSSYIVLKNAMLASQDGFADFLGVEAQTLRNWADRHLDFAHALDHLKATQKTMLINHGLSGRYNASITMMLLAVNHGMVPAREPSPAERTLEAVRRLYKRADELEREKRRDAI